ncbi:MAG: trigger factor [Ignavibacteriales bacterium]|nr:trigger factor [Ignavibacteriales bacterium]
METKINFISANEHELEVTLGYDEIQPEIDQSYKDESKKIEIPGFRKGKVPLSMLKKMFGDEIEYKAAEKIANKKYWEIVEEQKLKPLSTPKMTDLNFERGTKLFFKILYEVMPELELKNYTDNEISKFEWHVTDEHIDKEILSLLKTNSTKEDANIVEDQNYIITVDLQRIGADGKPDGEMRHDLAIDLSDERVNIQIFENANGKKIDETFNFSFKDSREVEENGEKKIIEEEFNYEAKISSIKKIVLPEFNDEFVQKVSKDKFKTVEEWKENIRKGMQAYYDGQSEDIYVNSLLNTVVKNNDFEPPHGFVHKVLDNMLAIEEEKAKRDGHKHFDAKEAEKHLHKQAEWSAKWQIIIASLAKKENISVEQNELKESAEKEAAETGISVDKLLKFYNDTNKMEVLLENKIIDFLKKNNKIKIINPDDLKPKTNESEG